MKFERRKVIIETCKKLLFFECQILVMQPISIQSLCYSYRNNSDICMGKNYTNCSLFQALQYFLKAEKGNNIISFFCKLVQ